MSNPVLQAQFLVYEYVRSLPRDLYSVDYSWINTEAFQKSDKTQIRFQADITRDDGLVLTMSIGLHDDCYHIAIYASFFPKNECHPLIEVMEVEPDDLVAVAKRALAEMKAISEAELEFT